MQLQSSASEIAAKKCRAHTIFKHEDLFIEMNRISLAKISQHFACTQSEVLWQFIHQDCSFFQLQFIVFEGCHNVSPSVLIDVVRKTKEALIKYGAGGRGWKSFAPRRESKAVVSLQPR